MRQIYIINVILFLAVAGNLYAQHEKPYIRKGTEEYTAQNYGNSEVSYQKALEKNPESFEAHFNLGDAFYKQEKYDKAIEQFTALSNKTTDKQKLAQIYHNIGNSQLKQTKAILKENKLQDAIKQIDKSIESYKNSLKNNPVDKETKFNLSYAQKLKKLLEEQQKQNQNNQDKNQQDKQNQDKNQQDQQNQDQNQQNQEQNQNNSSKDDSDGDGIPDKTEKGNDEANPRDSDKDGTPDYKDNDSDNDGKSDAEEAGQNPKEPQDTDKDGLPDYRDLDSNNDGKPDSEDSKQSQGNPNQISKEDALRLLEAIENDEKDVQDKLKRVKGARVAKKEKDW